MADEATTTIPTGEVENQPPLVRSGMQRQLDVTLKPTDSETQTSTASSEEPKKYDYSFFKDLKPEDYEAVKEYEDEKVRYKILESVNDRKKFQRITSERERRIQELESAKPDEELAKHREFIEGMRKDAIGTYKKYQKDFNLPEPEFLERQFKQGDNQSRLEQWQEVDLIPQIEKKFKIESGTFTYDPAEAYKAGTPSYDFRIATEKQEKVLADEYQNIENKQQEIVAKVNEQTNTDMKYLRETFFPTSDYETSEKADEAFVSFLTKLDENQEAIRKGEMNPEINPFALRNIFKGMHFDTLVAKSVDKAVKDLHAQYNAKGLYLPSTETPTDASQLKGGSPTDVDGEGRAKYSPMLRRINRTLSTAKQN